MPNLIGVAQGNTEKKVKQLLPGYMAMGEKGMGEMAEMNMGGPKTWVPMMSGEGQFGPLEMGGMFTVVKVREGIKSYDDPGDYVLVASLPEHARVTGLPDTVIASGLVSRGLLLHVLAALVATWSVFDRLPEPLPTHFGFDGKPNGWMPRAYGAWGMPAFAFLLWAFVRFLPLVLPKSEKQRLAVSSMPLVAMFTAVFMAAVHVVILYVALAPGADVTKIIFALMGVFFVALGLVMPRLRRNPVIGIRTPWTLTSDENWARTHRLAGYSMVVGGVLGGLVSLAGGPVASVAALACFLGSAIVPAVWSLLYARRQDPG